MNSKVLIIMGSDSDYPVLEETSKVLTLFEIPHEMRISSAHRSPRKPPNWWPVPPIGGGALNGVDALYSIVQMPGGIPVATMAIGKSGAKNAGILAAQILALTDTELAGKLVRFREEMEREVEEKDAMFNNSAGKSIYTAGNPAPT